MEVICRLCSTDQHVNNDIFDERSSIYFKIVTYLPIKVFKGDNLPQRVCDTCKSKVDDFVDFCNEAVEVQNRLQAVTELQDTKFLIDLTVKNPLFKLNGSKVAKATQTDENISDSNGIKEEVKVNEIPIKNEPELQESGLSTVDNKSELSLSQTNVELHQSDISNDCFDNNSPIAFLDTDSSDDLTLNNLKKRKKKLKKDKAKDDNKDIKKTKKNKKEKFDPELFYESALNFSLNRLSECNQKNNFNEDLENISVNQNEPFLNGLKIKREVLAEDTFDYKIVKEEIADDDQWFCCICFLQTSNKKDMSDHYRTHADMDIKPEIKTNAEIINVSENPNKYFCSICKADFTCMAAIEKHIKKHNSHEKLYRCSLCEKKFKLIREILNHGKTHSYSEQTTTVAECALTDCATALRGELCPDDHLVIRPRKQPKPMSKRFVCDLCDEVFVYMRYLREHRNKAHPEAKERKFINRCMHCSREFAHLNSLRRHLRSHTGERNFLCNICGKALSSWEHLKFHIRIHTGYKPNICKTCGKGFVKKCNLTLHERVHSGEKPHVCSHCGKAFSQRSTLVIHERYHSGSRPYVCSLCGKGFVAKGLLSMHLKTTCI